MGRQPWRHPPSLVSFPLLGKFPLHSLATPTHGAAHFCLPGSPTSGETRSMGCPETEHPLFAEARPVLVPKGVGDGGRKPEIVAD